MPTGEFEATLVELILDLLKEGSALESRSNLCFDVDVGTVFALDAQAVGDVVEDALREGVRFLEYHSDFPAQCNGVDVLVIDVFPAEREITVDACDVDQIVHPVDRAQER